MSNDFEKMKQEVEQIKKEKVAIEIEEYMKNEAEKRALARQIQLDELRKLSICNDSRSGREISHWADALEKAENAINAEVMSYNDWRAAMMGLLTMFASLNKALHYTIRESFLLPAEVALFDQLLLPLKDKLQQKLAGDPEVDLPILEQYVGLNEDGTLDIQLSGTDGNELISAVTKNAQAQYGVNNVETLKTLFEKGVVQWLKENGYNKTSKGTFVHESKPPLDTSTFEELKNNTDTGLNHFLTEHTDITIRPTGPR